MFYNNKNCIKCKYHGYFGAKSETNQNLCCDYAVLAEDGTCTKKYGTDGKTFDRRGNDPDNCLLFQVGEKIVGRPR